MYKPSYYHPVTTCVYCVVAAAVTAADYPGDTVPLPPAATGQPMHNQASHGSPKVCGG